MGRRGGEGYNVLVLFLCTHYPLLLNRLGAVATYHQMIGQTLSTMGTPQVTTLPLACAPIKRAACVCCRVPRPFGLRCVYDPELPPPILS